MIPATLTPIIGPLVAELAASRQTIERRADQLVTQAGTIGRLGAELATAQAILATLEPSTAPDPQEPPHLGSRHALAPIARAADLTGATPAGSGPQRGIQA